MKKNPLVGVVASIIIILCGIYIGTTIKNSGWLNSETAAVINSQLSNSKVTQNTAFSAQELYSIVKQLNSEIEKTLSEKETVEAKTPEPSVQKTIKTISTGDATVVQGTVSVTKSDDSVKGAAIGPIDQEKLHRYLIERKNFLMMLAKADPRLFLLSSLSVDVATKIPTAFSSELESNVAITGIIDVLHVDDFDHPENSRFEYFLKVGNERLSLYLTSDLPVISGGTFRVAGKRIGNLIVAENKDAEIVSNFGGGGAGDGPTPPPDSVGKQKTLVVLIRFEDYASPLPATVNQVHNFVFNDHFQKFYKEQSYDKTSFYGDVLGWYSIPGDCYQYDPVINSIEGLIANNNINLSGYDRLMLVPQDCGNSRGWSFVGKVDLNIRNTRYTLSVGMVPISTNTISGGGFNRFEKVLSHEMGHSLGVVHANALDCGEVSYSNNCTHIEYGNYFDNMGFGSYSLHFNAHLKEILGWVLSQNTVLINRSGRYTINPLEVKGPNQKYLAKINIPGYSNLFNIYNLEYRKGVGYDEGLNGPYVSSNQSGLFVNISTQGGLQTSLLDMRATTDTWYWDVLNSTLNVGETFVDESIGLKIGPVIEANDSGITFDVSIEEPVCIHESPLLLSVPNPIIIGTGINHSISISFTNQDPVTCYDARFGVEQRGIPDSFQPTILPEDVIVPSGYYGNKNIFVNIPTSAQLGMYPFTYTVTNRTTGNTNSGQTKIQVVQSPIIYAVSPASGAIGTNVTISGQYFSANPRVVLTGPQGYFSANFPSNGSTVNFQIPASVYSFHCPPFHPMCQDPTTPGFYHLSVSVGDTVYSNIVTFEVTQ